MTGRFQSGEEVGKFPGGGFTSSLPEQLDGLSGFLVHGKRVEQGGR